MQYRPEIDGLRAIAIIPVVLFHAHLPGGQGGYVGVDMFFVISGYLITGIIQEQVENNQFSLINFYERRARRILPLLVTVVGCAIIATRFGMPSVAAKEILESALFALGFVSNLFFLEHSGYFDTASELQPLLHTWSLSVEEQFYLFYPLPLVLAIRTGRTATIAAIGAATMASLFFATRDAAGFQGENFFLLHSRIWELGAGGVTWCLARRGFAHRLPFRSAEVAASLAVALIAWSIFNNIDDRQSSHLPNLAAVGGTALIILAARKESGIGRVLSFGPIVMIGTLSYGWYLWHQPILAYYRIYFSQDHDLLRLLSVVLISLAVAGLSHFLIESPARKSRKISRELLFSSLAAATSVLVACSIAFQRFDQSAITPRAEVAQKPIFAMGSKQTQLDRRSKFFNMLERSEADRVEDFESAGVKIIGDSMSVDLFSALALIEDRGFSVQRVALDDECHDDLLRLMNSGSVTTSCKEEVYEFHAFIQQAQNPLSFVVSVHYSESTIEDVIRLAEALHLAGHSVYIVGLLGFADMFIWIDNLPHDRTLFNALRQDDLMLNERMLAHARREDTFSFLNKFELFCSSAKRICSAQDNSGKLLFIDRNHLSVEGIREFSKRIQRAGWTQILPGASSQSLKSYSGFEQITLGEAP